MMSKMFNKITILGVGLIGASFALAMKKYKLCDNLTGCGRNLKNIEKAKDKEIIDSFELDPVKACNDSDLILFSTPVGSFIDIGKRIRSSLKRGAIVTDVGSVKGKLVFDMEALMPEGVYFIGGHPIAGSDRSGIDTATADIFTGAKYIVTPTEKTDTNALEKIIQIWKTFGSIVELINPYEHDRIFATVSHLPHLLAYAIMNTVADIDSSYLRLCGQGFIDTTRIASSSPELWRDICILNRENLLDYIHIFQKNLDRLSQYLRASDSESLEKEFKKARTLREGIGQH
ncbi:MAG: prephenate dehydrogenase/arogenate dehydrogenase family protein [Nitrospira sp.]|nr:prephenate dehydrogenase/arogenate dehydrogenase family protein [Nitrospira sp.]